MRRSAAAIASALLFAGCTTAGQQPPLDPLPSPPTASAEESLETASRLDGSVTGPRTRPSVPEISAGRTPKGATAAANSPDNTGDTDGSFVLDFAETDIHAVIDQILGSMLKVDYTIDPDIKGTVTFKNAHPMPRTLLLPTLEMLLHQNGATLVQAGPLYRILPSKTAAATPSLAGRATAGSEVIRLRYTSAAELAKVLQPLLGQTTPTSDGALRLIPDPTHNALVINGDSASRAAVIGLIQSFDTDFLAGQSYALFPVTSGSSPRKMANELGKVFQSEAGGALADVVRILPMENADAVLVVAPTPAFIADARRLFALVDTARAATARNWHVYYAQGGESADLAALLQRAFTPNDISATSTHGTQAATSSGFGQSQLNGNATSGTGSTTATASTTGQSNNGTSTSGGTGVTSASQTGSATAGTGSPATEALSATGEEGNDNGTADTLRIILDRSNNAILFYATPDEEDAIEAMLHKIDIPPLQVRIDATVAEVELTDDLKYGTQFYLKKGGINGLLTTGTSTSSSNLAGTAPGFTLNIGSGNAEMILSALSDITNVRVLSSPEIMVLDNRPAHLLVGNLIPYLTQSSQSTLTSTSAIVNSVNYRETGIILDVTPRVGKAGLVTLDLSQEVSALGAAEDIGGESTPTFSDRQVRSRVVVQDGHTVGLAGLISDNVSQENAGIPLLKDIPYLGSLFSTQTNTRQRTELMVLITPHVERDQREIRLLTEEMRRSLPAASMVQQEVNALPPSGSSNPNAKTDR